MVVTSSGCSDYDAEDGGGAATDRFYIRELVEDVAGDHVTASSRRVIGGGRPRDRVDALRTAAGHPDQRNTGGGCVYLLRNAVFRCSAPAVWNSLPQTVLSSDSVAVFKSRLKTFLFSQAFSSFSAH